ncbi:YdcF family protein [Paenibacillus sp. GD4]|uniref:YdcF family protein n=1 Tax=Paenibacillus sp. GD4 TaxID=3068890 RepID=UPI0027968874|nr:YdcF family protein [Paenibacillus sp. GD4]MDQ1909275.1 YdcF family protein [Paenibacillus sp. GD4]
MNTMMKRRTPRTKRGTRIARNKRSSVGFFKRVFQAALLITAVCVVWVGSIFWRMWALPEEMASPKEVGIVLGAALWQEVPSPALRERLDRAVELYQTKKIRHIIVSGGYDRRDSKLTEAEGMRNYLVKQGIPAAAIVLENKATSTYENLVFSQQLMEEKGWTSSVIITHRYHAVRALDIAKFIGMQEPTASPMDSKVLMMAWHKGRETLALTKWQWDKLQLSFGISPSS